MGLSFFKICSVIYKKKTYCCLKKKISNSSLAHILYNTHKTQHCQDILVTYGQTNTCMMQEMTLPRPPALCVLRGTMECLLSTSLC